MIMGDILTLKENDMVDSAQSRGTLRHVQTIGKRGGPDMVEVGTPVGVDFTFNTPISILMDKCKNIWVTDTGNSQIIVFDHDLNEILYLINARGEPVGFAKSKELILPFHLCDHPYKNYMYVTDPGTGCVDVFEYCLDQAYWVKSFGCEPTEGFLPLMVPNGITIVPEDNGEQKGCSVWVNDEFYHDKKSDKDEDGGSNRCVKFDDDGGFLAQFRKIKCKGKKSPHVLQWPQGMSSDKKGNVYLANTGHYEILRFKSTSEIKEEVLFVEEEAALFHSLGDPSGLGKLDVMRGVSVAGEYIFVPDQSINSVSVYGLDGKHRTIVRFTSPHWNSLALEMNSISDFLFSLFRNWILLDPYQVCKGVDEDVFFITEPWISRVCKVKMKTGRDGSAKMELIKGLGARRDKFWKKARISQLNAVASVIGMKEGNGPKPESLSPSLPFHMKYNPLQRGFQVLSKVVTWQYKSLYNLLLKDFSSYLNEKISQRIYLTDAGNWTIKAYSEKTEEKPKEKSKPPESQEVPDAMWGMEVSGNLALAVYHPPEPLLGQLCPGTPILFASNFLWSTILMYQFNPLGELVLYGLPFGVPGKFSSGFMLGAFGVGGLLGPAGIAVNPQGEIFIADTMNGRISKWQLLQTGQAVFRETFKYSQYRKTEVVFTPVDVALDSKSRVFVCDQYNSAIRLFDSEGKSLWSYGKAGHCDNPDDKDEHERFMMPTSIAVDNDYLIVSDPVNRVLKVFKIDTTKDEDCLEYVAGMRCFYNPPTKGGMWCPFFIYAANNHIYVPDSSLNIINVYEYKDEGKDKKRVGPSELTEVVG